MGGGVELSREYTAQVEAQIVALGGANDKSNQEGAYGLWQLAVSTVRAVLSALPRRAPRSAAAPCCRARRAPHLRARAEVWVLRIGMRRPPGRCIS
jgi:hypothetical protein